MMKMNLGSKNYSNHEKLRTQNIFESAE